MLKGLQNFLTIINENWTTILVIIGLVIGLWKKIESYLKKSDEEKMSIAKQQISQSVLRLISEAERDYDTWRQAGQIKRSKVIQEIYMEYPILSKFADQDELIKWIDSEIDNALKELRKVIKENTGETSLAVANTKAQLQNT